MELRIMYPETPNFDQYKARFDSYILDNLVNDPRAAVTDPNRAIVKEAYDKLNVYFTDKTFRDTLTVTRKNNIEGQINAILDQFQQMLTYIGSTPPQLIQNLQGVINNIQSYLEDLDLRFWTPYKTYQLEGGGDVNAVVADIKKAQREVEDAKSKAQSSLSSLNLLTGDAAVQTVSNYFQIASNGMTVQEYDEFLNLNRRIDSRKIFATFLFLGISIFAFRNDIDSLAQKIRSDTFDGIVTGVGILLITLSYPIKLLVDWINKTKPGGYERSASLWFMGAIASVIGIGVYSSVLFLGFDGTSDINKLIPKVVALLAPAYLVRFCVQNYRVNMHLASVNAHKAIAAKSVLAYTDPLSTSDESIKLSSLTIRGEIQKDVARLIFDPGESGFITTKEGAGSSDSFFEGTPINKIN